MSATTANDCKKLSSVCAWCDHDKVCLHVNSTACRAPVPRNRAVASWVWLLITICALVVVCAVILTLFLTEASFKSRWTAMSTTDSDFAVVGRGNKDGLFATD